MLRTSDKEFQELKTECDLLEEKVERLDKLTKECRLGKHPSVSLEELHLLEKQLSHMRGYLHTLEDRIDFIVLYSE